MGPLIFVWVFSQSTAGLVYPEYLVKFSVKVWLVNSLLSVLPHPGQFSVPPHPLLVLENPLSLSHVLQLKLSLSSAPYWLYGARIWVQVPTTFPKFHQETYESLPGQKATWLGKESLTQVLSVTKHFYFARTGERKLGLKGKIIHLPSSTLKDLRALL